MGRVACRLIPVQQDQGYENMNTKETSKFFRNLIGKGPRKVSANFAPNALLLSDGPALCRHFWSNSTVGSGFNKTLKTKTGGKAQKLGSGPNCSLALNVEARFPSLQTELHH